ncbi:MAG: hypothetical protein HDS37_06615 [Bacteroides sp.]|nr:hypothetical protein [Bacteroides sp.]
MDIVKVYSPNLFAVRYDGDEMHIYRLVYEQLTDECYLRRFFESFGPRISDYLINTLRYPREEVEEYISEVNDRMIDIDEEIEEICQLIRDGSLQDFGEMFVPHSNLDIRQLPEGGGRSAKYGTKYLPVKCWGLEGKPSLVRIYAIELSLDCYIIIYGGIKIDLDTNACPTFDREGNETTLEAEIRRRVKTVCEFLELNGIIDNDGLIQFIEEDHEDK